MKFGRPIAQTIYYALYRRWIKAQCWSLDRIERKTRPDFLNQPPPMLRFRVGGTASLDEFLAVGRSTADRISAALESIGRSLGSFQSILDFGCGCGRTLVPLMNDYPTVAAFGTDVDRAAIEWCRVHLVTGSFSVNSELPPCPYPDGSFDLIYCISVFTHLSAERQLRWLSELHRVIRPNGIVIVSIHGEKTWDLLPPDDVVHLREEGFLFNKSSKLHGIMPDWYHTAFHSREYVERVFSSVFEVRSYIEAGLGYQDLVVLRR